MNTGFELVSEAAKPKRAVEDAPMQQSMRAEQKIKRNPDSGQKKARRAQQRKTAAEHTAGDQEFEDLVAGDLAELVRDGTPFETARVNTALRWEITLDEIDRIWGKLSGAHPLITYVDEHGHRSTTPPKMPHSIDAPPSRSYFPPNTWAASLDRVAFDPENDADWDTLEMEQTANDIARGICPLCTERLDVAPVHPDFPEYHKQCIEDREKYGSKESSVNFNRREAEILSAMGKATLAEQHLLAAELAELRSQRQASIQEGRDIDVSAGVIRDHLTPVLTHGLNTTATDWLTDVDEPDIDTEAAVQQARTEASAWFNRTSSYVRADRDEFAEQATGKARVVASQFGSAAATAHRAFLDTVAFLHKRAEDATVVDPLPDSAPGPQNDQTAPWTTQMTTGDTSQKADHDAEMAAGTTMQRGTSLQTQADDSPGQVDEDQSGNAESTITDYDTMGNDPGTFDEIINGPLKPTGPVAVPSTRAPNVSGSRKLADIAEEIGGDWEPTDGAAPYLGAMRSLASVEDDIAGIDGRSVVAYFLAHAAPWQGETALRVKAELRSLLDGTSALLADLHTADSQNGEAKSDLKEVEVGDPNDRPMWPWEMPELPHGNSGGAGGAEDAANVGGVHTPGQGVADYPQPGKKADLEAEAGGLDNLGDKKAPPFGKDGDDEETKESALQAEGESSRAVCNSCSHRWSSREHLGASRCPQCGSSDLKRDYSTASIQTEAGYPLCAAGCNVTVSAGDALVNTDRGLAHAACMERVAAGTGEPPIQQGASLGEGEVGTLVTEGDLQKGAPFAGYEDFAACVAANKDKNDPEAYCGKIKHQVEDSKKSSLEGQGIDTEKLAAFRQRVAANVGS